VQSNISTVNPTLSIKHKMFARGQAIKRNHSNSGKMALSRADIRLFASFQHRHLTCFRHRVQLLVIMQQYHARTRSGGLY